MARKLLEIGNYPEMQKPGRHYLSQVIQVTTTRNEASGHHVPRIPLTIDLVFLLWRNIRQTQIEEYSTEKKKKKKEYRVIIYIFFKNINNMRACISYFILKDAKEIWKLNTTHYPGPKMGNISKLVMQSENWRVVMYQY